MGTGSTGTESSRSATKGFGSAFGNGNDTWSGGIWSSTAIGSGIRSNTQDIGRAQSKSLRTYWTRNQLMRSSDDSNEYPNNEEAITGSGSLLPSSESDSYNMRHGSWTSVDDTSPGISRVHTDHSNASPVLRQHGNQLLPSQPFDTANSTYFAVTPASTNISSRSSQKNFLDPTSGNFESSSGFGLNGGIRSSRQNSDEDSRFVTRKMAFESNDSALAANPARPSMTANVSGYNSSVASRAGSQPPSRSDIDQSSRRPGDVQGNHSSRFPPSMPPTYRQNLSAQTQLYNNPSQPQKNTDQLSPSQLNQLLGDFGNLNFGREGQNPYAVHRDAQYGHLSGFANGHQQDATSNGNEPWNREDDGYARQQPQFSPTGSTSGSLVSNQRAQRNVPFASQYSHSPTNSDARNSHHSPYYSSTGTPPAHQQRGPSRGGFHGGLPTGQAALLDHKLRGLQQEQQGYLVPQNQMRYRNQFSQQAPYEFHPQNTLRPNQFSLYYPMPPPPNLLAGAQVPRGPARDHDLVQPVRSALLEEFRNNSKTNKRYELKVGL